MANGGAAGCLLPGFVEGFILLCCGSLALRLGDISVRCDAVSVMFLGLCRTRKTEEGEALTLGSGICLEAAADGVGFCLSVWRCFGAGFISGAETMSYRQKKLAVSALTAIAIAVSVSTVAIHVAEVGWIWTALLAILSVALYAAVVLQNLDREVFGQIYKSGSLTPSILMALVFATGLPPALEFVFPGSGAGTGLLLGLVFAAAFYWTTHPKGWVRAGRFRFGRIPGSGKLGRGDWK